MDNKLEKLYREYSDKISILNKEFNSLVEEYKKPSEIRKNITKIEKKEVINDSDQEKLEKLKHELSLFEKIEIDLFKTQKSIEKSIVKLDNKKNFINLKIVELKDKVSKNKSLIDENFKKELEEENKQHNINIEELEKKIVEFRNKKIPTTALEFDKHKINRKLKENLKIIKKIDNSDSNKIQNNINEFEKEINNLQSNFDSYLEEINKFIDLIETINGLLEDKTKKINTKKSFVVEELNVFYGNKQALFDINIEIPKNKVISIIGPSGCGKSTFLKTLNRINDEIPNFRYTGKILLDGKYDIHKLRSINNKYDKIDITELRTKVGMIFQQPNPFPFSISKNVTYGPRINGTKNKIILSEITKDSLIKAALWNEVKDNLKAIGTSLSGGQQQRLCIARAIANEPEILLMDEPTSALDPIAAHKIEQLILELKKDYTIIMVTHSMQQAARISDYTAFFYQGELIEFDRTKKIFSNPKMKKTEDYIRGRFG